MSLHHTDPSGRSVRPVGMVVKGFSFGRPHLRRRSPALRPHRGAQSQNYSSFGNVAKEEIKKFTLMVRDGSPRGLLTAVCVALCVCLQTTVLLTRMLTFSAVATITYGIIWATGEAWRRGPPCDHRNLSKQKGEVYLRANLSPSHTSTGLFTVQHGRKGVCSFTLAFTFVTVRKMQWAVPPPPPTPSGQWEEIKSGMK